MEIPQNDRPTVELSLNTNSEELTVTWGPDVGPWGIYSEKSMPIPVKIKEWELYVGTKAIAGQLDDPDEPGEYNIFYDKVDSSTIKIIPMKDGTYSTTTISLTNDKSRKKAFEEARKRGYILARVIGYFDSQNESGHAIVEGIYSDVVRQVIPKHLQYSMS